MNSRSIQPATAPFHATIAPPGSKSLTNRAMVLAALAKGKCTLRNVLFADDTKVMIDGLRRLGFQLDVDQDALAVSIHGRGGEILAKSADLFCGNSGTTIRFLAAMCAIGHGTYTFDGIPRMRQRPIGPLMDLLKNLGVRSEYLGEAGYPPVRILPRGMAGGIARYGAEQSSQFLSAVIMAAPYARHEVRIDLHGEQTSWPYVAMTMQMMDHFGTTPELIRDHNTAQPQLLIVPREPYRAVDYDVEPDASNATYFLAAAAINSGSSVTIRGLGKRSLQGDVQFARVLRKMGASVNIQDDSITVVGTEILEGIGIDLADMPDTAQTLAVVALFADGPTTIRGLHTLRIKETDRLSA
ncbi:MAG: 3-phosphoshikimate 1-carboxyvinyltransferase, partial [Phycisphaerae bacterium]|nr:3-phosphoshikimate 1-carboxyvinyltransferase [Phycisphaerae bacterium]